MIDWIEVSRVAHQLGLDHGQSAYQYAAKVATEAEAQGNKEDAEFWNAVSAALAPREFGQDGA